MPPGRAGEANDALRRTALFSVYFYAVHDDAHDRPQEYRPIPVAKAASILHHDAGPVGEERRRRAIAKLAAGGLEGPRREALEILGAPIDRIQAALDAVTFDLRQPTYGAIYVAGACYDARVDYDRGSGQASRQAGQWLITANKTIRITSSWPGLSAWVSAVLPYALKAMGEEIRRGVCCAPRQADSRS